MSMKEFLIEYRVTGSSVPQEDRFRAQNSAEAMTKCRRSNMPRGGQERDVTIVHCKQIS